MEWWNGFFSHPFCLLVCLFYGLVFSLPALIFRQSCVFVAMEQIKTANTVLTRIHMKYVAS